MKIGILGAAAIAPMAVVYPAQVLGHELVAVAARDVAKARDFADKYGVAHVAASYDDLINDPTVELVYNPLPNSAHAEWNIKALNAGKHVLAEKPFTRNAAEAHEVVKVARRSGKTLVEAYHYLFHPVMQRAIRLVAEGRIGSVRHVEVQMMSRPPAERDHRWSAAMAGGSVMDMACYGIHAMQQLGAYCEGAPTPEMAHLTMAAGPDAVDVAALVGLKYPNGATGSVWSDFRGQREILKLTIYGGAGTITAPSFVKPHADDELVVTTEDGTLIERLGAESSYTHQLRAVVAHITEGTPLPVTLEGTVATMDVIDWIFTNAGRDTAAAEATGAL